MKKFIPVSLALMALSGGLVACSPAGDTDIKPTQDIVAPPTESAGSEAEKSSEQIRIEMTDLGVQTDLELASDELDELLDSNPGYEEFNEQAQQLLNSRDYNEGTEMTFEAHKDITYTLKGWNEDGWKFTSKADALIYESESGFTNAWAASRK